MTVLLFTVALILVLLGLVGTALPALPGIPLVFAGLALAAWVDGFQHVGVWTVGLLGVLMVLAVAVDVIATAMGTKLARASRWAFVGAAIGTLIGVVSGLWGLLLFPFVGAMVAEWLVTKHLWHSTRAGMGAWAGLVLGVFFKLTIAFSMVGIFIAAYWVQ